MARVRMKINVAGFDEVRNWASTQSACMEIAGGIAARAEGMSHGSFTADVRPGSHRCHAMVKAADAIAARDCLRRNALLKAK